MMTWLMQDILQPIQIPFSPTPVWVLETDAVTQCFCLVRALWTGLHLLCIMGRSTTLSFVTDTEGASIELC